MNPVLHNNILSKETIWLRSNTFQIGKIIPVIAKFWMEAAENGRNERYLVFNVKGKNENIIIIMTFVYCSTWYLFYAKKYSGIALELELVNIWFTTPLTC